MFIKGLIIGGLITGLIEGVGYLFFKHYWDHPKLVFGYHIHHTVLGLFLIVIGIPMFILNFHSALSLFSVGFGTGMIISHTITGGFVFIEKNRKSRKNR